jgi:hypothetical protein
MSVKNGIIVALTLQSCGSTTFWIAMSNDTIGGYEPLMSGSNTVVNTPYAMTVEGGFSYITTAEMALSQGTFAPDQMMKDINGVLCRR